MEFRKRGLVPLGVAVVVAAAVFLTATRIRSDGDWSTADLSALYSCSNGDPGVAQAYADGSFEINDVRLTTAVRRARARASQVDWYVVAQNNDASSYDCARMLFRVHHDIMHQVRPFSSVLPKNARAALLGDALRRHGRRRQRVVRGRRGLLV
jgi:hypothetical protein